MIIGKPRRRSSARFLRVARRCASDATRASGDILLSGIGFRPLYRFFFMGSDERSQLNNTSGHGSEIQVRFGDAPKPARESRALPLNATTDGSSGDNRARSHQRSKRMTPMLGRNSLAKVVLPAPLQPAMNGGGSTRLDRVSPYQIRIWRKLLRPSRGTLSSFPAFLIRSLPLRLGRVRLRTCARLP